VIKNVQVLKILFEELIPKAGSSESKVFYLKMKGEMGWGWLGWDAMKGKINR